MHTLVHLSPIIGTLRLVQGDVIFQVGPVCLQVVVELTYRQVHILFLDHRTRIEGKGQQQCKDRKDSLH